MASSARIRIVSAAPATLPRPPALDLAVVGTVAAAVARLVLMRASYARKYGGYSSGDHFDIQVTRSIAPPAGIDGAASRRSNR